MAFGLFKKKREVIDWREKDSDMPIPAKMMEKLKAQRTSISTTAPVSSIASDKPAESSGGFFSFFGGGSNSTDSANSTSTPSSITPVQEEVKTDFWGNPIAVKQDSIVRPAADSSIHTRLDDVSSRFTRLMDRVELLEKKIERLERRGM